jgi:selenocysteine lyase/cysteine desulfurase
MHQYGPVVSFTLNGMKSTDVSYILQNSYGILTRAGLMCAPLIHSYLGTEPDGVVRVSFSPFTKEEELQELSEALREIVAAL